MNTHAKLLLFIINIITCLIISCGDSLSEIGPQGQPVTEGDSGNEGIPGSPGNNGLNSLVSFVRSESLNNCHHRSGLVVNSGLDQNSNSVLEDDKILVSSYVCDGHHERSGR